MIIVISTSFLLLNFDDINILLKNAMVLIDY